MDQAVIAGIADPDAALAIRRGRADQRELIGSGAKVAKVSELGGSILVPLTAAGEMGKFAVVQDPQGGVFTIMQFNGPGDPPPG